MPQHPGLVRNERHRVEGGNGGKLEIECGLQIADQRSAFPLYSYD